MSSVDRCVMKIESECSVFAALHMLLTFALQQLFDDDTVPLKYLSLFITHVKTLM